MKKKGGGVACGPKRRNHGPRDLLFCIMNEAELRALLEEYNRRELIWGIVAAVGSLVLWVISYVIVVAFVIFISTAIFDTYPTARLVHSVSLGVMVILLLDGLRHTGELFDLDRFRNSFYSIGADHLHVSVGAGGVSVTRGNPLQAAFAISQLLLCAPRSSLAAIRHCRSRIRIDDDTVKIAIELFHRLAPTRQWADVAEFGADAGALVYLDLADLLWTRLEDGRAQVRLAPAARAQYLGQ